MAALYDASDHDQSPCPLADAGVIFAKEKGGRAKFKVTQSVRGGLAGGRHKMWRQKPEEPSSRGAPTQLFLTLEH